jgi:hypothetical protein
MRHGLLGPLNPPILGDFDPPAPPKVGGLGGPDAGSATGFRDVCTQEP